MIHLEIISPLRHIINLIFKTGKVPSHFKQSVIVPIYKSGSKNEIKNHRPISLINNFTKTFEKVLKDRLIQFYTTFNVLSKFQFGFLANCSTLDAMYSLTSEVVKSLNSNKKSIAIFIDLAKAFDTVPHLKLIKVLELYGVRGIAQQVFKCYLEDRDQFVKLNNTISERTKIKIGVPQGTILGPLLFITYVNSLH